jgi:hypothetical protein
MGHRGQEGMVQQANYVNATCYNPNEENR